MLLTCRPFDVKSDEIHRFVFNIISKTSKTTASHQTQIFCDRRQHKTKGLSGGMPLIECMSKIKTKYVEDTLMLLILYQRKIGAGVTPELPLIEKTYVGDVSVEQTSDGEVHVYAHPSEPVLVHQQDSRTGKVKFK